VARLSRRVGAGFHGSGVRVLVVGVGCRFWSAGVREGLQSFDRVGDHVGPRPVRREFQVPAAGCGDELGGGGEETDPQAAGLPEPDLAGQGEHRHPGEQVQGELADLQPDLVLRGGVEGQVTQAGGAGGADAVLGSRPLAVAQFESGDRRAGGVGSEADIRCA